MRADRCSLTISVASWNPYFLFILYIAVDATGALATPLRFDSGVWVQLSVIAYCTDNSAPLTAVYARCTGNSAPLTAVYARCTDNSAPLTAVYARCTDNSAPLTAVYARCTDSSAPLTAVYARCTDNSAPLTAVYARGPAGDAFCAPSQRCMMRLVGCDPCS
jgi:hypothetical protein